MKSFSIEQAFKLLGDLSPWLSLPRPDYDGRSEHAGLLQYPLFISFFNEIRALLRINSPTMHWSPAEPFHPERRREDPNCPIELFYTHQGPYGFLSTGRVVHVHCPTCHDDNFDYDAAPRLTEELKTKIFPQKSSVSRRQIYSLLHSDV